MHFYVPVTYKSTALRFGLEVKKKELFYHEFVAYKPGVHLQYCVVFV